MKKQDTEKDNEKASGQNASEKDTEKEKVEAQRARDKDTEKAKVEAQRASDAADTKTKQTTDIEKNIKTKRNTDIKKGKYVSGIEAAELAKLQKRKTIFVLLSTLFFAVSLFLPVVGREKLFAQTWLVTLYLMFDIALIVVSVAVAYLGRKKHSLRVEVDEKLAPRGGFDKHTYVTDEVFNVMHIVMAAAEIAIGCVAIEVWGIVNMVVAVTSTVFSVMARQILFRTNAHNMEYFPPVIDENAEDAKDAKDDEDANASENTETSEKSEGQDEPIAADEFYIEDGEITSEDETSEEEKTSEKTSEKRQDAVKTHEKKEGDNGKNNGKAK